MRYVALVSAFMHQFDQKVPRQTMRERMMAESSQRTVGVSFALVYSLEPTVTDLQWLLRMRVLGRNPNASSVDKYVPHVTIRNSHLISS